MGINLLTSNAILRPDGGHILTHAAITTDNGYYVVREGDTAVCNKHGVVTIVQGSSIVNVEGHPAAYDGCMCSCGATAYNNPDTNVFITT